MKTTVYKHEFVAAFLAVRPDNFSMAGLEAMFDYFEEMEESCGDGYEMELDVIAICCEFSEYEDLEEFQENYNDGFETLEDVHDQTTVIEIPGTDSFIIQDF